MKCRFQCTACHPQRRDICPHEYPRRCDNRWHVASDFCAGSDRRSCPGVGTYLSVRFLTKYFQTRRLTPFAIYCVVRLTW